MISVVLSNYNGARFLGEAIGSVAGQSFRDFELIVVDDGSTDASPACISACCSAFPEGRVRALFCTENRGQAARFNDAVAQARGDWVCFLDSDDVWHEAKLARVSELTRQYPTAAFIQHNLTVIEDDHDSGRPFRDAFVTGDYASYARRAEIFPDFAPTSGLCFSRRCLDKVLPIPELFRTCADGYLTRTAMLHGDVISEPHCLGGYRIHGANNTFQNPYFDHWHYIHQQLLPTLRRYYASQGVHIWYPRRRHLLRRLSATVRRLSRRPKRPRRS